MKPHYFEQGEADKDDIHLQMAKAQGYVPKTCLLGGSLVMEVIKGAQNPCKGCEAPRDKCKGRSRVGYKVMKKYQIIYADPPWSYEDKALAGERGAICKYPVMNAKDLALLPINNLASINSALFLWVTMPKLNEVFDLIQAWGFTYKTVAFTWIKTNKNSMGYFIGMGRWTRANAELCLLATKGKPIRMDASVPQLVVSDVMDHSHKPAIVRGKIVQLMGDLPRIELFARRRVEGWDCWGNEVVS